MIEQMQTAQPNVIDPDDIDNTDAELIEQIKSEGVKNADKCLRVCNLMVGGDDNGLTMREACKLVGLNSGTFCRLASRSQTLMQQYARARKIMVDLRFEQFMTPPDLNEFRDDDGRIDNAAVTAWRGYMDNLKWAFSKVDPQRYGDRIDHNINSSERKITRIEHVIVPAPTERPALPDESSEQSTEQIDAQ